MDKVNEAVAGNLKMIRKQRNLSLDMAAKATGVSKSMLAQIEKGTANPTVSTVWKIANGLRVSFTELVTRADKDFEVIHRRDIPIVTGDDGRYLNYPVFPYDESRRFEIYYIEMEPGCYLEAEAHPVGSQEFIIVFDGGVEILVNGEVLSADSTGAIRFRADTPHSYRNIGEGKCRLSMTISY